MAKMFFVFGVGLMASGVARFRGPIRARGRLSVADADKASRRDGTDLPVRSEVCIRMKGKISGKVFFTQREPLAAQCQRSEMAAPHQALRLCIVKERFNADIVPGKN